MAYAVVFVCILDMQRFSIGLRVNCNRLHFQFLASPNHSNCNLPTIGNQDLKHVFAPFQTGTDILVTNQLDLINNKHSYTQKFGKTIKVSHKLR